GRLRLSPPLSRRLTTAVAAGGALLAAASLAKMLTAARAEPVSAATDTETGSTPEASAEPDAARA
ncbi:MAG: hypothetical protein WAK71_15625, partial [Streptosporangiaceae bacterium]